MKPVPFQYQNTVYAENQEEYLSLPSYRDDEGVVLSCWKLTFRERIKILFTGRMWFMVWTFNAPLQPQLPRVDNPFAAAEKELRGDKRGGTLHLIRTILCFDIFKTANRLLKSWSRK